MEQSILTSIKKMLGIMDDYEVFDEVLVIHINSALMNLNQLAVGTDGFRISDSSDTWADFLGETSKLNPAMDYVYFKVRLSFDPPSSTTVLESFKEMIKECEFRLNSEAEYGNN